MKRIFACILALALALPMLAAAGEIDVAADAQAILDQLMAGEVDAYYDRLAPEVQAAVPPEALATFRADLEAQLGAFEGWGASQTLGLVYTVEAEFAMMPVYAQVIFGEGRQVIGLAFSPGAAEPVRDTSVAANEEEVAVGPYGLAGLLTLPELAEGERAPAVVLVQGSGAHDRNEAIGETAIFRDLAEDLSAQGIAVLRYDKRTYAMGTGEIPVTPEEINEITVYDETIEDAVAAVALLRADERIDPDRVFILGHSLGGMQAGRMQEAGADANGLIIMAGTLRSFYAVVVDQLTAMDQGSGSLASEIATAEAIPDMTEEEARAATLLGSNAYYFWEEQQHDLTAIAEADDAPLLILQGTEDANIYAAIDYVLWEAFAAAHPERDIELHLYEGIDHYYVTDGRFDATVLADIVAWVQAR